jgi:hypothetical protein
VKKILLILFIAILGLVGCGKKEIKPVEQPKQESIAFDKMDLTEENVSKIINQCLTTAKNETKGESFPIKDVKLVKVEIKDTTVILSTSTNSNKFVDIKNDTAAIVPYIMPELFKNSKVDIVKIYMTATATKEEDKQKVTDELANITFEKSQKVDYKEMKTQNYDYVFKIAKSSGIASYIE